MADYRHMLGAAMLPVLTGCVAGNDWEPLDDGAVSSTTTASPPNVESPSSTSSVASMSPSTTSTTVLDLDGVSVRWRHDDVGMTDSFLASSGRIVLADGDRVYVADGFSGSTRPSGVCGL